MKLDDRADIYIGSAQVVEGCLENTGMSQTIAMLKQVKQPA